MKKYLILMMTITFIKAAIAQSIKHSYDSLGRLTQVIYPDSSIIKYTYDAAGNRLSRRFIQSPVMRICPQTNISLFAGLNDNNKTYQWQVDTSTGFKNVSNNMIYSGATIPNLNLSNVPSAWYGYKFRCLISGSEGISYSATTTIKFESTWIGSNDSVWENSSNWGCKSVPDQNTDVIITNGAAFYPIVNSSISCRSLIVNEGTSVTIANAKKLTVAGQKK